MNKGYQKLKIHINKMNYYIQKVEVDTQRF